MYHIHSGNIHIFIKHPTSECIQNKFKYKHCLFCVQCGITKFKCDQAKGGQLSPLLYNAYTDDLNHHLKATGVGCHVRGAWLKSLHELCSKYLHSALKYKIWHKWQKIIKHIFAFVSLLIDRVNINNKYIWFEINGKYFYYVFYDFNYNGMYFYWDITGELE